MTQPGQDLFDQWFALGRRKRNFHQNLIIQAAELGNYPAMSQLANQANTPLEIRKSYFEKLVQAKVGHTIRYIVFLLEYYPEEAMEYLRQIQDDSVEELASILDSVDKDLDISFTHLDKTRVPVMMTYSFEFQRWKIFRKCMKFNPKLTDIVIHLLLRISDVQLTHPFRCVKKQYLEMLYLQMIISSTYFSLHSLSRDIWGVICSNFN